MADGKKDTGAGIPEGLEPNEKRAWIKRALRGPVTRHPGGTILTGAQSTESPKDMVQEKPYPGLPRQVQ